MTRIALILTALLAACDVGSVLVNQQVGGDSGAGSGDGSTAANCVAPIVPTTNVDASDNGTMVGGCMSATGCHSAQNGNALGAGAPEYSFAGTVYHDAAGTQPYSGATILVTAGGVTKKLVSAENGNFFITQTLFAAPTAAQNATASASACPTQTPMVDALVPATTANLAQSGGNCNACHTLGVGALAPPIYITP